MNLKGYFERSDINEKRLVDFSVKREKFVVCLEEIFLVFEN